MVYEGSNSGFTIDKKIRARQKESQIIRLSTVPTIHESFRNDNMSSFCDKLPKVSLLCNTLRLSILAIKLLQMYGNNEKKRKKVMSKVSWKK